MSALMEDIADIIRERDELRKENEQLKSLLKFADARINKYVKEEKSHAVRRMPQRSNTLGTGEPNHSNAD